MSSILRTAETRFANLGFPYHPQYVQIDGMRMHYIDEGRGDPILCLHGEPTWSYLYRKLIPTLVAGNRVIAPDFIGFGRSDKLPNRSDYTLRYTTIRWQRSFDRWILLRSRWFARTGAACWGWRSQPKCLNDLPD